MVYCERFWCFHIEREEQSYLTDTLCLSFQSYCAVIMMKMSTHLIRLLGKMYSDTNSILTVTNSVYIVCILLLVRVVYVINMYM